MAKQLTPKEYFAQTEQQAPQTTAKKGKVLTPDEYFKQTGRTAPKIENKPFPQLSAPKSTPAPKAIPMAPSPPMPAPTTAALANAYRSQQTQPAPVAALQGALDKIKPLYTSKNSLYELTKNVPGVAPEKTSMETLLGGIKDYGDIAGSGLRRGLESAGTKLGELYDLLLPTEALLGEDNPIDKAFAGLKQIDQKAQTHFESKLDTTGKQIFGTLMQGTGAAAPQALMAMATGGGSLAAQGTQQSLAAAQKTAPVLVSAMEKLGASPSFWYSYSQTATDTYNKEIEQGATPAQAAASGTINGLLGAIVEVGGGLEGFDRQLPALKAMLKSALEEGQEEIFQYTIENLVNKAVGSNKAELFSLDPEKDAVINPLAQLKQGAYGAAVGGILGGGQQLLSKGMERAAQPKASRPQAQDTPTVTPESLSKGMGAVIRERQPLPQPAKTFVPEAPAQQTQPAPAQAASPEAQRVQEVARKIGVEATFADLPDGVNGRYEDGRIVISNKAAQPLLQVFAHEATHHIESSGQYQVFADFALAYMEDQAQQRGQSLDTYRQALADDYAAYGQTLTDAEINHEIAANFGEHYLLTDYDAIERMARDNRNLFTRVYAWIRDAVRKLGGDSNAKALIEAEQLYRRALRTVESQPAAQDARQAQPSYSIQSKVGTEDFKRWFGDWKADPKNSSKVVYNGPDGVLPRPVYHGSPQTGFSSFDTYASNYGLYGFGGYFSESPDVASEYAMKKTKSPQKSPGVYEVYLNIKNPIDMDAPIDRAKWDAAFGAADISEPLENAKTNADAFRIAEQHFKDNEYTTWEAGEAISDLLSVTMGYDGITHTGGGIFNKSDSRRHRVWIAFHPEQVKSSISNAGSFSPDSANIRQSIGNESPWERVARYEVEKGLRNPAQIANLKKEDASTTPSLPKSEALPKGNKESKFAPSVQESAIVEQEGKEQARGNEDIDFYRGITNEKTLDKALETLKDGGERATRSWLALDPKKATTEDVAQGFILMKQYQDAKDYQGFIEVVKKLRQIGTSGGQLVQIFSILGRMTPEGMVKYAQGELDSAFEEFRKRQGEKWAEANREKYQLSDEDVKNILDKMERAALLPDGRDKTVLLAQIATIVQDKIPTEWTEKVKTLARISMLLNPKTNTRNIMGNALIFPAHIVSDFISAPVDRLIGAFTGTRTTGLPRASAMLTGAKTGLYESFDDFRKKINTREMMGDRFEIGAGNAWNPALAQKKTTKALFTAVNTLDRVTNFMLDAGDRPFFEAFFINSLNNQMRLNNAAEASPHMVQIATQEALQRTWQDDNGYTKFVNSVRKALNLGKGYGFGTIMLPFTKTPANLTKAIIEFSPAGLVKALTADTAKTVRAIQSKTITPTMQKQYVSALGKAITGSALYILGYTLAAAGITSGDEDKDKDVAAFTRNVLGILPRSVKIGGASYSYDWALPLSAAFSTMANLYNSLEVKREKGPLTIFNVVAESASTGMETLFEQSFMQGVQGLLEAEGFVDGIIDVALGAPTQFVPTLFSQAAQLADDTARRSFTYGAPIDTAWNRVKAKIPGAVEDLEPVVDTLGRDVKRYGGDNTPFNVLINPALVSKDFSTPEAQKVYNIYKETGDKSIFPRVAPYYLDEKGERRVLTPEEKTEFQRVSGQTYGRIAGELIKLDGFNALSNEDKAEILADLSGYAYALARKEVVGADLSSAHAKTLAAKEAGVSEGHYLLTRHDLNVAGDNNEGPGDTALKRQALLENNNLTPAQKSVLDDLLIGELKNKVDYASAKTFSLSQSSSTIQKGWASVEKSGVKYDAYLSYADKLAEIAKGHEGDGDAALKREALFKDKSLTPAQKSALDKALIGELKNPIDYTNEETYTISQMTPAAQLDWKDAKARKMKVADFARYYPIATKSGTTKAERINNLVKAGMTRDRADAFYTLVHKKR